MRKLQNILGHANLVLAVVFLVLLVINIFNPAMQFLSSGVTNVFLWLFCFCAIALGALSILQYRRHQAYLHQKAVAAAKARRQTPGPLRPPAQRR